MQSWSSEQRICCCCKLTYHIAASSLIRCACAIRRISLIASRRSEYYCSSLCRPALHWFPHFRSSVSIDGLPCRPTVHSRHNASTVRNARHIRYFGGSSGWVGESRVAGSILARAKASLLEVAVAVSGCGRDCSNCGASRRNARRPNVRRCSCCSWVLCD